MRQGAVVERATDLLQKLLTVAVEERCLLAARECLRNERGDDGFTAAWREDNQHTANAAQRPTYLANQVGLIVPQFNRHRGNPMPKSHLYGLITARLLIDLLRCVTEELIEVRGIAAGADVAILGAALYIANAEGRPMTATKIAAYIGMPRPTVIRKLEQMKSIGRAVQDTEKRWRLAVENGDVRAASIAITSRQLKLVRKASTELSNLDTTRIATQIRRT